MNDPQPLAAILDIETMNLDMAAEGLSFSDPTGWVISCACVHLQGLQNPREANLVYVRDYGQVVAHMGEVDNMTIRPLAALYRDLSRWHKQRVPLITHNGTSFDLPILSKPMQEGGAGCAEEISRYAGDNLHIDTCARLFEQTGLRIHLSTLCEMLLGTDPEDHKLMPAAEAPIAWSQSRYGEVIRYCIQDCILTGRVRDVALGQKSITIKGHLPGQKRIQKVIIENVNFDLE